LKQKSVIKSIVTQIDGYYVTSLLTSLYLNSLLESKQKLTAEENQRVIDEYNYLLSLYPEILKPTTNVEIMKAAIKELNTKLGQISYLIPKENKEGKKTPINPEDVTKEQQNQQ
jgi:Zn-dependent M32 family carboxypeptidase